MERKYLCNSVRKFHGMTDRNVMQRSQLIYLYAECVCVHTNKYACCCFAYFST